MNFTFAKELMDRNFVLRTLTAIICGGFAIWCILNDDVKFLLICTLLGCAWEWFKINQNRKGLLFISGLAYLVLPFAYLWFLAENHDHVVIILWLIIAVWATDIFAYIGGRIMSGPKFIPSISPNKTWSGTLTGFFMATLLGSFYLSSYYEIKIINIIASTACLSIFSIIGDLVESKVKRYMGIKDTGGILPGHGGMIDRLDSFLLATYTLPLIVYLLGL